MEVDRLSALPEPLLLDIILRLDSKEAARTAVLSKQWRFLWTDLPFPFSCSSKNIRKIRRFAAGVHAALALRRGPALETLSVNFYYYQCLASDVDSWLDFAAKNKVKNVYLDLLTDYENFGQGRYDLPPGIYSNSSLEQLSLEKCTIASMKTPVVWRCLKFLWLKHVDFRQRQAIGEILSGCPLLETLTLYMCNGFSRLEIGNRSFSNLWVTYYNNPNDRLLEIWAPYMKGLHIGEMGFTLDGRKVRFENVESLESAGFNLSSLLDDSTSLEMIETTMEKFLHLGRSLKKLSLDYGFSMALSIMATHGWRFAHVMKVEVLSLCATPCGVVAMLESCPFVQELVLNGYVPEEEEESVEWGPIRRYDLKCDLMHLKTVKFKEYFDSSNSGEPMLTMANILLRRAPNLEKIVICQTDDDPLSTKEFDDLKNTLIQSAIISHNASIEIKSS